MSDTILEILSAHHFTRGLSDANRRRLAAGAQPFSAAAGDYLSREGDQAHAFYLLQSGHVEIGTYLGKRGSAPIQRVGPGDVVGWSWLLEPYHWEFDARAVDEVAGLRFDAAWLRTQCEEDHDLGYHLTRQLLAVLARRLSATRLQRMDVLR